MIVDALRKGEIQPWSLAFRHRRQLIMHRDATIRDAARAATLARVQEGKVFGLDAANARDGRPFDLWL
jgi:hypothetical protein